jgi:hypothetical protein
MIRSSTSREHDEPVEVTLRIPPPPEGIDAWVSLAAGGWLLASGLGGRTVLRWPALALGGWLLARGASGLSLLPAMTSLCCGQGGNGGQASFDPQDPLDEGLEETFPASDPVSVSRRPR